ncbi:PTS sugar transporter subunit IIB [Thermophilibacter immobilis]|uniref:PTS system mannose-specific EIIAB component n=1 Tax=Thermophilibacter immobilis TaxID=2779519 RepID=A0A7S7RTY8_9ACTN|nr:PTS sugar transporter subunit IIB [Thermophilibacter immobilis]QOY60090.1 PTS mannose transporter subunit IIAB [Thermophilibacter immobilis]
MVSIVLASHGTFAEGIKTSGQMIFGPQENVATVTLTPEMGPGDLKAKLLEAVQGLEDQEQVLFLVDLQGGTPWNQVSLLLDEEGHEGWVALGGLNLPMLVSAYGARPGSETAADVAKEAFGDAKAGVVVKPEDLAPTAPAPAAPAPSAPVGSIPEGTVLGDGHIKFVLTRVDTRLLHGQVATTWTKMTGPDRIIVVSDAVAHDELRKSMIEQAAPPGVKAHVIPIDKMIEVAHDPRFGATKAMLLFETPQDLLRAVEGGVDVHEVNIGSMAHSVGKVVVNNAIAMDNDDVETLEKLKAHGIKFDIRKVPADSAESFDALIKKAKAELA